MTESEPAAGADRTHGTDPGHPLTIPAALTAAALRDPGGEAVVDGDVRLTWAQLREQVRAAVKSLIALGVRRGDRIAVWAPNSHRWVVAALATTSAGAVLVPVNTRYKGAEARWLLERSGARLLFVENGFLGKDYLSMLHTGDGPRDAGRPASLERVVTFDAATRPAALAWEEFLRLGAGLPGAEADAHTAGVRPDDPSDLLFTSGTTGRPKGALTTHRQNLATYRAWSGRTGLTGQDRYLIVNPMFHCFGYKAGVLACLLRGTAMVLHPVFEVGRVLRTVEAERITVLPGPPTIYTELLGAPGRDGFDLSSLRLAVTGAAVVPVALVRRMRAELFPDVLTAYGLTESCGTVSACSADDDAETVALTAGRPLDGVEVRVVDGKDRTVLPAGQDGEILVRGYNVMRGYLDDPEATAAAVDADGWLATGDVGHLDARGNLVITDRLKDMFVVGGFNVYPAEVEQVLTAHEAVAEAAVLGIPDARLGEVGRAYVTARPGAEADPGALAGHCRERLANFKVPREIVVLGAFPRNATGKVDKTALRTI
ncbi:fatty acid--CoA ligase family protein [Streptomyces nitrosporeus]|uniref:Fatty acid--CoA ligase family protein n=1 Tax=Streptomyces nitrosporeus TaxID=28894 RepID=A0A5J6F5N0_9ACTN|nr:FadD3 family acyl-CoA ligase [Streptomyces nitrosporeus]QEU71094.1 fatty acid--CoA ligase family protein [Streptomyces nitrosporeus]GGZ15031.1 3-[(3aS,4S,7aS)-7a-methyl-1,5-dioxo-octahydro-1H-inden-4-yl]propanoyl:CoA ligase [Streptomyces nitrosporeus]